MTSEQPADDHEHEYGLVQSFYIDTAAYTQRDREMFTAGVEFGMIRRLFQDVKYARLTNPTAGMQSQTICRENESRIRMMAGQMGIKVKIEACERKHDPDDHWAYMTVEI